MDSFFGIGLMELIVIAVITLLVMGPERMPGMMREGAKYIRMIRGLSKELTDQFRDELDLLDELNPKRIFDEATDPDYEKKQAEKKAKKSSSKAKSTKSTKSATAKKSAAKKPAVKSQKPALGSEPVENGAATAADEAAPVNESSGEVTANTATASEDESSESDAVENSIASPEMLAETEEPQPVAMHVNGAASIAEGDRPRGEDGDQRNDERG